MNVRKTNDNKQHVCWYTKETLRTKIAVNDLCDAMLLLQVHDLEFAQIEVQVVEGLKNGNAALKKMHQVSDISIMLFICSIVKYLLAFILCLNFVILSWLRHPGKYPKDCKNTGFWGKPS